MLRPFEFLEASNHTIACFKDLFGEISSRLPIFSFSKKALKTFSKRIQTPKAIMFDLGGGIIGICKVLLGFHLGLILGLVGGPKRIFFPCDELVVALIDKKLHFSFLVSRLFEKQKSLVVAF